jgi:hypothetical protein
VLKVECQQERNDVQDQRKEWLEHYVVNVAYAVKNKYYVKLAMIYAEGMSEDIGENYRVRVKLSAALPKDTIALASMYSMLADKKRISQETFLDLLQKLPDIDLAAESPDDEQVRILRGEVLMNGKVAEALATALAKEYVEAMGNSGVITEEALQAALRELEPPPPPPQQAMGPQQSPMGPGGPPPQGMPPGPMGPPGMMPQQGPPMMPGGGGMAPPPMPQMPQLPPGVTPEMLGGAM